MMAAADFFDFLFGYFVGLGMQIFERIYLGLVIGWISPIIEENIDFISEYIDNFVE
jgi:hypothetical protein